MQQVLQSLKTGKTSVRDIPCPSTTTGKVLIASQASLISIGTEKMLIHFGKASLLSKARQQPDKVKQVMQKIKTDGLFDTIEAVKAKLDEDIAMGYANAGVVIGLGEGVANFQIGDRVVSNGPHAEIVNVGQNLVTKIPDNVSDNEACFAVLGAIALNAIRLAEPTIGETFVVIGMGLLGILTARLLQANGCQVIGVDINDDRVAYANAHGVKTFNSSSQESLANDIYRLTQQRGADGVIIAASTDSAEPLTLAAHCCRPNGRIILSGVVKCEFSRHLFYEKSLSFRVACAYGPGRYDVQYEEKGQDYPFNYVRWTAGRNIAAFIQLLANQFIRVDDLITDTFNIAHAEAAYDTILNKKLTYGIILQYPDSIQNKIKRTIHHHDSTISNALPTNCAVIGAGNFVKASLLPNLKKLRIPCQIIASKGGASAAQCARRYTIATSTTDLSKILDNPRINSVIIATRHNSHASLTQQCLTHGKHVYVEKPLCINQLELAQLTELLSTSTHPLLMVGFNRRFSAHTQKMKSLLAQTTAPKNIIMTINAGALPNDHWNIDANTGGGRLIAEGCHFIDLCRYLVGHAITGYNVHYHNSAECYHDSFTIQLQFADSSSASIHYLSNGHKAYPKENITIFCDQRILVCDNFRKLKGFGWKHFKKFTTLRQDKGHRASLGQFFNAIETGGTPPIPLTEIKEVTHVMLDLAHNDY